MYEGQNTSEHHDTSDLDDYDDDDHDDDHNDNSGDLKNVELLKFRERIKRRTLLIGELRKAYLRDIVALKNIVDEHLSKDERAVISEQWKKSIPSIDLRQYLMMVSPEEASLSIIPCETCGGTVEIVHHDGSEIERLAKEMAFMDKNKDELKVIIATRGTQLEILEKKLNEISIIHGDEKRCLYAELKNIKATNLQLENTNRYQAESLTTLKTEIGVLKSVSKDYTTMSDLLHRSEVENERISNEMRIMEDEVSQYKDAIKLTMDKYHKATKENDVLAKKTKELTGHIDGTKEEMNKLRGNLESYQKRNVKLQTLLDVARREVEDLTTLRNSLQLDLETIQVTNAKETESLERMIDKLQEQSALHNEKLREVQVHLSTTKVDATAQLENNAEEIANLNKLVVALQEEVAILKKTVADTATELQNERENKLDANKLEEAKKQIAETIQANNMAGIPSLEETPGGRARRGNVALRNTKSSVDGDRGGLVIPSNVDVLSSSTDNFTGKRGVISAQQIGDSSTLTKDIEKLTPVPMSREVERRNGKVIPKPRERPIKTPAVEVKKVAVVSEKAKKDIAGRVEEVKKVEDTPVETALSVNSVTVEADKKPIKRLLSRAESLHASADEDLVVPSPLQLVHRIEEKNLSTAIGVSEDHPVQRILSSSSFNESSDASADTVEVTNPNRMTKLTRAPSSKQLKLMNRNISGSTTIAEGSDNEEKEAPESARSTSSSDSESPNNPQEEVADEVSMTWGNFTKILVDTMVLNIGTKDAIRAAEVIAPLTIEFCLIMAKSSVALWKAMQCIKEDADMYCKWTLVLQSLASHLGTQSTKGLDQKLEAISSFETKKSSWMSDYDLNNELMTSLSEMVWDKDASKMVTVKGCNFFGFDNVTRHVKFDIALENVIMMKVAREDRLKSLEMWLQKILIDWGACKSQHALMQNDAQESSMNQVSSNELRSLQFDYEERVKAVESQLEKTKVDNKSLMLAIEMLKAKIDELAPFPPRCAAMMQELNNLNGDLNQAKSSIETEKQENIKLTVNIDTLLSEISGLTNALETKENETVKKQKLYDGLESKCMALMKELDACNEVVAGYKLREHNRVNALVSLGIQSYSLSADINTQTEFICPPMSLKHRITDQNSTKRVCFPIVTSTFVGSDVAYNEPLRHQSNNIYMSNSANALSSQGSLHSLDNSAQRSSTSNGIFQSKPGSSRANKSNQGLRDNGNGHWKGNNHGSEQFDIGLQCVIPGVFLESSSLASSTSSVEHSRPYTPGLRWPSSQSIKPNIHHHSAQDNNAFTTTDFLVHFASKTRTSSSPTHGNDTATSSITSPPAHPSSIPPLLSMAKRSQSLNVLRDASAGTQASASGDKAVPDTTGPRGGSPLHLPLQLGQVAVSYLGGGVQGRRVATTSTARQRGL